MSDFLNNLNKVGMILQAGGGSLAGRDGMSVVRDYQAQQERERKQAAIAGLMGQAGIAGPQRALLDTMPLEMQQEALMGQLFPQPTAGVVIGDKLVNPYSAAVMGDFGPEPLSGDFLNAIGLSESGNNFGADNGLGYTGRVQAGQARLDDFSRVLGAGRITPEQFRQNPALQQKFEQWHFGDLAQHADRYAELYGTTINGIPFTREAAMGIAHLGGKGGLDRYVQTGGRYNPADAFGTRLSDYQARFANTSFGQPSAQPDPAGLDRKIDQITAVLATGGGTPAQREALEFQRQRLMDERKNSVPAGPNFDLANQLRDDLRAETDIANYTLVRQGFDTIETLYSNPGAVSDYALAVAFAKIVDPGSVAREGEVSAVQSSTAISDRLKQQVINALNGTGALPEEARAEIASLGSKFYNRAATRASGVLDSYRRRAERANLPFDDIYAGGEVQVLPDNWMDTLTIAPNAKDRFGQPDPAAVTPQGPPMPPVATPQPAPPPQARTLGQAMEYTEQDLVGAISKLSEADRTVLGRIKGVENQLEFLRRKGVLQ